MIDTPEERWALARVAKAAAARAADYIGNARPKKVETKAQGGDYLASQVVTEVDREAERIILEALAPVREGLGLLTEETPDDGSRLEAPAFWCIDPLDGTLAYIEGESGPAVSIALVRRDGVPLVGVIHDIFSGRHAEAVLDGGLVVDDEEWWPFTRSGVKHVYGDRSFDADPRYREIVQRLGTVQVEVGRAAVLNAWSALIYPPAVYFKLPRQGRGGGSLWDYAATACCYKETGGLATTFAGEPLPLNRPDTTFLGDCGVMFSSDALFAAQVRELAAELA